MYKKYNGDSIKKLIDEGKSAKEIANILDYPQDKVSYFVSRRLSQEYKEKLKENTLNRYKQESKQFVEKLEIDFEKESEQGNSISNLAKTYNVSQQTIFKYIQEYKPHLVGVFEQNGLKRKSKQPKLAKDDLSQILKLSSEGLGIDNIAKMFNVNPSTIRYRLIKALGEDEYNKRHPKTRFTENNGWNGKSIVVNGETFQSLGEVNVATILKELNLEYELHTYLKLGDKIYYPDFYIKQLDLYIEFAGMLSLNFYRIKFMQKINDYMIHGKKCVVVSDDNIDDLSNILKSII